MKGQRGKYLCMCSNVKTSLVGKLIEQQMKRKTKSGRKKGKK
jgi:hypothetical protein